MKQFIFAMLLVFSTGIATISCNRSAPYQGYDVMTGPGGQQQVMFYDNGTQRVMEYAMFMSLMNNGGYSNVIHHYREPRYASRPYFSNDYRSWNHVGTTTAPRQPVVNSPTVAQSTGAFGNGAYKRDGVITTNSTQPQVSIITNSNTPAKVDGWNSKVTQQALPRTPQPVQTAGWKSTTTAPAPSPVATGSVWKTKTSSSSSTKSSFGGRKRVR
jgi:hypothetical protein